MSTNLPVAVNIAKNEDLRLSFELVDEEGAAVALPSGAWSLNVRAGARAPVTLVVEESDAADNALEVVALVADLDEAMPVGARHVGDLVLSTGGASLVYATLAITRQNVVQTTDDLGPRLVRVVRGDGVTINLQLAAGNHAALVWQWRGVYDADTAYAALDVVSYLGSSYIATAAVSIGVAPPGGSWELLAAGGEGGGGGGAVSSVAGRTGDVTLAKTDVGLGNVDNTADTAKPVSTAQQTALDGKSATGHGHAISDVTGLQAAIDGKAATGHAHVVSDVTGLQTALDAKATTAAVALKEDIGAYTAGKQSQTGTSYTLVLADKGRLVEMSNASATTLTVPPNSSVAIPVDSRIDVVQMGAGQTSIVAGSGVTIRSSGGKLKLTGQYSGATLIKRATDEWVLIGDISA